MHIPSHMANFIAYFSGTPSGLEAKDFEKFGLKIETKHFKKGDLLIRQGDHAENIFFLSKGLLRYMSLSADGKEFTQAFASSPGIAGSTRAMTQNTQALFSIEAMDNVLCLQCNWDHFYETMKSQTGFLHAYTTLLEHMFAKKEEREYSLLQHSAEQRYLTFLKENPQLRDKLSLKIIASYIAITPIALSRIRKQLK